MKTQDIHKGDLLYLNNDHEQMYLILTEPDEAGRCAFMWFPSGLSARLFDNEYLGMQNTWERVAS